jgi:hypothetical protein
MHERFVSRLRIQGGTAQGLFTLTGALANFAPSFLGLLYATEIDNHSEDLSFQHLLPTTSDLGALLIDGVCFAYISCAICFVMAVVRSPSIDDDTKNRRKYE